MSNNKNLTTNLKQLSKSACIVLAGVLSECEAHPKSGFFIEAGFETGMSSVTESVQKRSNPQSVLGNSLYQQGYSPNRITSTTESTKKHENGSNTSKTRAKRSVDNSQNETPTTASADNISNPKESVENKSLTEENKQANIPQAVVEQAHQEAETPQENTNNSPYANIKDLKNLSVSHVTTSDYASSAELYADGKIAGTTFSTTNPIATSYDTSKNQITIDNHLSQDLKNVKLVVKVADNTQTQGYREVEIATFESIPKNSHMTISKDKIPAFNDTALQNANTQNFEFRYNGTTTPTDTQEQQTKKALEALASITTNIHGTFRNGYSYNGCGSYQCYTDTTKEYAQKLPLLLLDLAYVLDSQKWADAVHNANFDFYDSRNQVISKEYVIQNMRGDSHNLAFRQLNRTHNIAGLASPYLYALSDTAFSEFSNPLLYDPKAITYEHLQKFYEFMHEYAHTRGYLHSGNMTYGNSHGDCGTDNRCNSITTGAGNPHGDGFTSLTTKVWLDMEERGEIPFQVIKCPYSSCSAYTTSEEVPYFKNLNSPNNPHYLAHNFMVSNVSNMMQTLSNTIQSTTNLSPTNKRQNSPMLGFNTQIGYQNYFNNIIGLSYYAMFNYNFSKRQGLLNKTQQYGVGGGVNLLIDFINVYKDKNFKSSFGVFAGARALYNRYQFNGMINASKHKGNVYFTTGFNYRYKHSKISLGISMPLIKQNIKAQLLTEETINEVALNENFNNMHVFMNYGWVF
ncbi:porin family protein [Helicobacter cetorum]|uniref:Outer membrane protein HomB n=1 Tax=Helicobacter cetorum (strain ATCC BAA-540 / CCUG 52418 / MIT 99-5656) TaxID=1163745 RepID=I0EQ78_HELCM|nr:hypothetical protein [Helicobacter cetorum]AFI05097.1 hypothetical protein HCD_00325 [Helicobacter cetorum MIT 99-5656]